MIQRSSGVNHAMIRYLAESTGEDRWLQYDRRKLPRPHKGTTLRRVLDITYKQIRETEAKKDEQTRKSS
jgi:hypothetical protein